MDLKFRTTSWNLIRVSRESQKHAIALICLPPAGGGLATFSKWVKLLPPSIELWAVQPAHRNSAAEEITATSFADLLAHLITECDKVQNLPCALFGHSLGGLVALELARHYTSNGKPIRHLFLSGICAPQNLRSTLSFRSTMTNSELLQFLTDTGGVDPQLLQVTEFKDTILEALRSDLQVLESYCPCAPTPPSCPISLLFGDQDPCASQKEQVEWETNLGMPLRAHTFAGRHFFIRDSANQVTRFIVDTLESSLKNRSWKW